MKKTVAIVLLFVHLFNAGGYMLLFQYLINRSDAFVEQQISKGLYNLHDLVEVKIPTHMSQIQNWTTYEPVSGQVQLKGGSYNYVKLKLTSDTLYLMCVPNYRTTKLINDNIIFAKQVSDTPLNKKGNTTASKIISFHTYYHITTFFFKIQQPTSITISSNYYFLASIPTKCTDTIFQPPQLLS